MTRRTILTSAAAAVLLAAGLTACNTAQPTETPGQTTSTPIDVSTPEITTPPVVQMGETYTYDDGLQITLTEWGTDPAGEYPGTTQTVPPGAPVPVYQVSITNGTTEPFDPTMVNTSVTNTTTGETASALVTGNSTGVFWSGMILPGNTAVHRTGYDIDPAAPTTTTITVDWDRLPLLVDNT